MEKKLKPSELPHLEPGDISESLLSKSTENKLELKLAKQRIKRVFLKSLKNGGNITQAMKEEGYSKSLVNNPQRITRSKSWKVLIDEAFPPEELLQKERKLWKQKDWRAWANSLDRIHKLKGSFIKKIDINVHRTDEFRQMKDDDLRSIVEGDYEETHTRQKPPESLPEPFDPDAHV